MNRRDFLIKTAAASSLLSMKSYGLDKISYNYAKKITILHTNDTHSHIDPFPKTDSKYPDKGGAARRALLFEKAFKHNPNTLFLDAGDMFQGTPYFNYYKGELDIKIMNMLGYHATTIGNHEFDNGIDNLATQLKKANFDILCANYDFTNTSLEGVTKPYKIIKKDGVKIGIFGLGIRLGDLVNKELYKETKYLDPVDITNDITKQLKEKEGCDLIICISHLGYKYRKGSEYLCDLTLAKKTQHIDLIMGGHTHTFLDKPTVVKNKIGKPMLVNQVGCYGICVGHIDFYFDEWNNQTHKASNTHLI